MFERRGAAEGLWLAGDITGVQEVGEVRSQQVAALVVEAIDRGVLDRSIRPLVVAVDPRALSFVSLRSILIASQIMSKRICREWCCSGSGGGVAQIPCRIYLVNPE